jgi:hypothetical protein
MAGGRGVRVVTEGVRVPFGEDFHQPAIKVIHRVVHDGFEAAVVFSMSFFNVVFQSDAEISVLAAKAHLLRSEHFYVLHRNFCDAIRAPVQFLFFRRKPVDIKFLSVLSLCAGSSSRRLDQFERFQLEFGYRLFNDRRRPGRSCWTRRRSRWSLRRLRNWLRRRWPLRRLRHRRNNFADQVRQLRFNRRPWAGLHGHGYESRKHFQRSSQRSCGSLRSQQCRQRIGWLVAGASRDHIVHGVMQFVRCALEALKTVTKRSYDCLFHDAGFLCHTVFPGSFARNTPSRHFGS